jgi:hypothetical protein
MWPDFISGRHHSRMAYEFEHLEAGGDGRLIINLGPRHSKSKFASVFLPAWYLGKHPNHKVIQCSVTAELAVGFGREVRNMIDSEAYKEIFPDVILRPDSKAAGRWATNKGGEYFAVGVSGSVTGMGANLCLDKDTIIRVNGNEIKVGDVEIPSYISSYYNNQRITKKSLTIHNDSIKINDDVIASLNHPFLTKRGWVEAGKLNIGDKILTKSLWRKLWGLTARLGNQPEKHGKV